MIKGAYLAPFSFKIQQHETCCALKTALLHLENLISFFIHILINSFDIKVNIGTASYWSQLMQVQTMDAFFKNGIIDDALIYLEHIPDGYVTDKEEIMEELKRKREKEAALSMAPMPVSTKMEGGAQK